MVNIGFKKRLAPVSCYLEGFILGPGLKVDHEIVRDKAKQIYTAKQSVGRQSAVLHDVSAQKLS